MGKTIITLLLHCYRIVLSPVIKSMLGTQRMCRYTPTCSEYALTVVRKYGVLTGGGKAIRRLLTCHPFAKAYGAV